MTDDEISRAASRAILASGIDYVLVGGLAVIAHTFSRTTLDVDFVVAAPLGSIHQIAPHFPPAFRLNPQPEMELLTGTYRWIVDVDGSIFRVEIFHLASDPHHQELFRRRRAVPLPALEQTVWIPTTEDLVIQNCAGRGGRISTTRRTFSPCKGMRSTTRTSRCGAPATARWSGWRKCARGFRRDCNDSAGKKSGRRERESGEYGALQRCRKSDALDALICRALRLGVPLDHALLGQHHPAFPHSRLGVNPELDPVDPFAAHDDFDDQFRTFGMCG